jgi:cell division inhibitor SepF
MANAFKRVAGYLGLMDEEELDHANVAAPANRAVRSKPSFEIVGKSNSISSPVIEPQSMDRIISLTPRTYSEARLIGEHYREGKPVIMNLSEIS